MRKANTLLLAAVLCIAGALQSTVSRAQQINLGNVPSGTVVGRLGSSVSGPAQAIPFATLLAQLNGLTNVVSGPATTIVGDMVLWNSIVGAVVKDSGIAVTGTGSLAFGSGGGLTLGTSGGTLSIVSGKTLTDTSATGAVLLLGATGGGFAAYAGSTCASNYVTAVSAAGAVTCTAKAATNSTVASPTAPNSTSAFTMQGLAGTITPAISGKILVTISGTITTGNCTVGNGVKYQISYGTGSAPTTNAALAGTQVGTIQTRESPTTCTTAADDLIPFSASVVITGLTVGTAYWLDLAAESIASASQYGFSAVNIAASEI